MDRVAELEANVEDIKALLANAADMSGAEVASLMREKRITLAELASLEGVKEGSTVDELTRRRQGRRAAAGVAQEAK